MKRTPPPQFEVAVPNAAPDFDDDDDDFKEVFWPDFDALPGETPFVFKLRFTFTFSGYRIKRIEEVQTHPVVIILAVRQSAQHIADHRLFFKHIQNLLRGAGFCLRKDELTVSQTGGQILIAFQTGKWAPNFEEILREPQEDMAL